LKKILYIRKEKNKIDLLLFQIIYYPLIGLNVSFIFIFLIIDNMKDLIKGTLEIGINKIEDINEEIDKYLPFIMSLEKQTYLYMFIFLTVFIIISLYIYNYNERTNKHKNYNLFKIKVYNDIPELFLLIKSLNASNITMYNIFKKIQKIKKYAGLSKMFKELEINEENGEKYYKIFQKYNYPKNIVNMIKYSEKNNGFINEIDNIIYISKSRKKYIEQKMIKKYRNYSVKVGIILPFSIIVFNYVVIIELMMKNITLN